VEYGKTSEVLNAYVRNTLELPAVARGLASPDPKRVDAFYKTLLHNVQSVETLRKIERVNEMTRSVLDKLKRMYVELVRGQGDWQDWHLPRLIQALKVWSDINPATEERSDSNGATTPKHPEVKSRLYHAEDKKTRACVSIVTTRATSCVTARV